jgi:hypothetical protein
MQPFHVLLISPKNEENPRVKFTQAAESLGQSFSFIETDGWGDETVCNSVGHGKFLGYRD